MIFTHITGSGLANEIDLSEIAQLLSLLAYYQDLGSRLLVHYCTEWLETASPDQGEISSDKMLLKEVLDSRPAYTRCCGSHVSAMRGEVAFSDDRSAMDVFPRDGAQIASSEPRPRTRGRG